MIISNMRNVKYIQSEKYKSLFSVVADVDVTTTKGKLWWKTQETTTRQVFRTDGGINWQWLETGKWTPEHQVEDLFSVLTIKGKLDK